MFKAKHKGAPPTEPAEALIEKGEQALAAGDLPLAEKYFGQATVAKPASAPAWYGKGRAFALQEEWEKALRCFSIATKFEPNHANAWVGLADSHLHLGDKDKARHALARAEELGAERSRVAEIRIALGA